MNWEAYLSIGLAVLLLVAGGYIKRLIKEIKDLVDCFQKAIADDTITKEEMRQIIAEA